ncbi:hypothetical protein L3X38_013349 [Prunus dulcis]|uniref:Uncharacterized protein n=1 Tax=Prunus dulcis TaxID=3755 RepID=A0AAD4ZG34_PRUDU|nr:hypothetical protein L3X38_013349 [Prunus dulcis]
MGSAPEEQLETEGQGISNDATQHKQHEYRVGLEEKLVWKSHLDQRHGSGNGEGKDAMVNHIQREILQVLDGTTGLNMLPQAREFNEIVGITGLILSVISMYLCFSPMMLKRSRNLSSDDDDVVEVDEKGKDGPWPENNEVIFIDLMDEEISKANRSTTIFSKTSCQTMINELHIRTGLPLECCPAKK